MTLHRSKYIVRVHNAPRRAARVVAELAAGELVNISREVSNADGEWGRIGDGWVVMRQRGVEAFREVGVDRAAGG